MTASVLGVEAIQTIKTTAALMLCGEVLFNYGKLWRRPLSWLLLSYNSDNINKRDTAVPRLIAIVEDEPAIAQNTREFLQRLGYKVSVFSSRLEALAEFKQQLPDLAIIDVGLGDEFDGGFDLCRELRNMAVDLPIIFLTARDSAIDEVSGLRLGADDYLTKDISQVQLQARIVALFRRVDAMRERADKQQDQRLEQGDLKVNIDRMTVHWRSHLIDLTVTELWIVLSLAKHPGHVKNRQQLMDAANVYLDDNTITSHIKRIRRKFNEQDPDFNAIKTAYGMGYRWLETS